MIELIITDLMIELIMIELIMFIQANLFYTLVIVINENQISLSKIRYWLLGYHIDLEFIVSLQNHQDLTFRQVLFVTQSFQLTLMSLNMSYCQGAYKAVRHVKVFTYSL